MVSLRMNARVLSVLFESNWLWRGGASEGGLFAKESAPFLPGGETTAPLFKHGGGSFCLVQLLNVQCIM